MIFDQHYYKDPITYIKDKHILITPCKLKHTLHPFIYQRNMHARTTRPLNPKTTAEYLRTYAIRFGGITHTSLLNNQSIDPIRPNLLIVVIIPAKDHNIYIQ
jgi:hypothetical protein